MGKYIIVDFNFLSESGLIHKINKEILHKYGLALSYNADNGESSGAVVAPDLKWEFDKKSDSEQKIKFDNFEKNSKDILLNIIDKI